MLGGQRRAARRVELVDVIVARLEAVLIGGADRRDQAVERPSRVRAVAPGQLIAVLLVETLRLLPHMPAALAVVHDRARSSR